MTDLSITATIKTLNNQNQMQDIELEQLERYAGVIEEQTIQDLEAVDK